VIEINDTNVTRCYTSNGRGGFIYGNGNKLLSLNNCSLSSIEQQKEDIGNYGGSKYILS
jgi:hypothetical protein